MMRDGNSSTKAIAAPNHHSSDAGARLMTLTIEERRARHAAYMRRYLKKNRERLRPIRQEQGRRYWKNNKKSIMAKRRLKPRTDADRKKQRLYTKRYEKKYPERVKDTLKKYNEKNPRRNQINALLRLEKRAGRSKPNTCDICHAIGRRIHFDHCHQSGLFRGWICHNCNCTLGYVNDDPNHLRLLIAYLEKHYQT
jgi:hypothetical protein